MKIYAELNRTKLFIITCIAALLCMSALAAPAAATTWYVDDDGGANFTDIQSAVNSASSGDTIYVYTGTYLGFTANTPYLSIIGEGADLVTVAPNSLGQYNEIRLPDGNAGDNATGTVLEGMNISTVNLYPGKYGPASDLCIRSCVIGENTIGDYGISQKNMTFDNNLILSPKGNYGINLQSDNSKFVNNIIRDSQATYGPIAIWDVTNGLFENNTIIDSIGAAAFIYTSNNCTFSKNNFSYNPVGI
ncbi:MAG: right-handed parallel beta-helix repeat-containing protein, partial [Methanosarcinaceae archaeon]|nr:right-handed parallel beta-helix repeat-containing protein [Methanosarcinaceae archaeon]